MDLSEVLQFKKLVAERVAAQPSDVRAPHCWFCASSVPWWECGCAKARAARKARDAGERNGYPRWNAQTNCIERLDEETIAFNGARGIATRWPVHVDKNAPKHGVETKAPVSETPSHASVSAISEDGVNSGVNTEIVHAVHEEAQSATESDEPVHAAPEAVHKEGEAARKAYRAEWQRQRRAKLRKGT